MTPNPVSEVCAQWQAPSLVRNQPCLRLPQFAKNEDFDQYPRQRQADRRMLQAAGCDAVFEPASLYFSREH